MKTMKLLVLLVMVGACEAPAPVTPILSVLKRTETCFALMTPDNPVAPELDIANLCDEPTVPTMFASVDEIKVVIDYGPEVDFAATTVAPSPEVILTVDGAPSDVAIDVSPELRVGARAYFVATFRAPAGPSVDVRIAAGAGPGFETAAPTVFTIVPPPITFDVVECFGGVSCTLVAAVGQIHARVAIPGDVALPVAIHQTIDQLALPDPVPPTISTPTSGSSVANILIEVPRDGAMWQLTAQVGGGQSAPIVATLEPPVIATHLNCTAPCTVSHSTEVVLTITAPAGIHPARALVTTHIAGVPQLVAAPVDLTTEIGDLLSRAELRLVPPQNAIGVWQIDVSVAGYAAPAIEAYVQ